MHSLRISSASAFIGAVLTLCLGTLPARVSAQDGDTDGSREPAADTDYVEVDDEAPPVATPEAAAEEADAGGPATAEEAQEPPDESPESTEIQSDTDPRELEDTDYFFLGAFARGVLIPGFIQEPFVDGGGVDGLNIGTGLTFNYRRNNFNLIVNGWWNNAQADGYFRGNGDPMTDIEYIDIDLGVIFLNAAFLWSFPVDDGGILAIELGFDLGFGITFGEFVRTEATPDGDGHRPCTGPGGGSPGYCEPPAPDPCYNSRGGHYNCSEPNWTTEGGDTPLIVPWVSLPHLAVRIKPIRQVQIRIDGGYGIYNFFFGGSVSYGF